VAHVVHQQISRRWRCRPWYSGYHVTACGIVGGYQPLRGRTQLTSILKMETIFSSEISLDNYRHSQRWKFMDTDVLTVLVAYVKSSSMV
jgi:hypothetical protein